MFWKKQNLLWLMITSYATCQITCSKIMIIAESLADTNSWSFNRSTCTGKCDPYTFNITNIGGKYEVRMKEMVKNITMWFLPIGSQCLPSDALKSSGCLKILPVDPENKCKSATYGDGMCKRNEENRYILILNGSEWMCVNCTDGRLTTTSTTPRTTTNKSPEPTVQPHEMTIDLSAGQNSTETPQTNTNHVEPETAAKILEIVESLVEQMEKSNKTNAGIVKGNVIGVLQTQPKNKPTKDINICYSSNQNMINIVESNQTDYPWSVKIPGEAFDKSRLENNGSAFVAVLRFINMGNKDETETHAVLNNESYGITMGAKISNLKDNIDMTIKKKNLVGNVSCVSWDGKGTLNWTTFGCETEIDDNTIKCSCSHLTFFAVLMVKSFLKKKNLHFHNSCYI